MSHSPPFHIEHFDAYCKELERVGIEPGYVMYTNRHASNGQPATRLVASDQLEATKAYISSPSDQAFIRLVTLGVLLDTEWDRSTQHWELISFHGWEKLHHAFWHLLAKADKTLIEIAGLSSLELTKIASNGY